MVHVSSVGMVCVGPVGHFPQNWPRDGRVSEKDIIHALETEKDGDLKLAIDSNERYDVY
jgi:hypothetical protein